MPTRPGSYVSGEVLTAANMNLLPAGTVGNASTGSSQTGIGSSATNLTGLSVAVTAVASRRYKISGIVNFRQRTSSGLVTVEVYQDTVGILNSFHATYETDEYGTIAAWAHTVPGAGTPTFRLRARTSSGTVDINPLGSSTLFSSILVEDIGT